MGQGVSVEMLIRDIQGELARRPYELVSVPGGWMFRTRVQLADAIRALIHPRDQKLGYTEVEMAVLCAIAYHPPVDRAGLVDIFGSEISRDILARLRHLGLIATGPRSPRPGASHRFVKTEQFLLTFELEGPRNLPELKD